MHCFVRFATWILCLLAWLELTAQQPFACDESAYIVAKGSSGNSSLYRLLRDTTENAQPVLELLLENTGYRINALGFNVRDNLLYGVDLDTDALLRLSADGSVDNLGVPIGLDTTLEYHAGAVKSEGGRMFVIGRDPGGYEKKLYTIQLQAPYYAGLASIVSDEPVRISDMVFDPVFGLLIGFDEVAHRIINITTGGAVSTYPYQSQPQVQSLGSLWFNSAGHLLGYGGSLGNENKLFRFHRFNGKVEQQWQLAAWESSDGCSCPYRLWVEKRFSPQRVVPCADVLVTYRFVNRAGIAYGNLTFTDAFPPPFEIREVLHQPGYGESVNGLNTSVLEVNDLDVLLGEDSIVLRVNTGDYTGVHSGQALLEELPYGLGTEVFSDDPQTVAFPDPSSLEVKANDVLSAVDTLWRCSGSALALSAPANATAYLWSNGATGATITVTEGGRYWVQVTGPCGVYGDTVQVMEAPLPKVNLGEDQALGYGTTLHLQAAVQAAEPWSYEWQSQGVPLSCTHCPQPSLTLQRNTQVVLTLTDGFGCKAADTLLLVALPDRPVYFPTAFSPNDDGLNDLFYPQGKGDYTLLDFRIFDRWGGMVFARESGLVNHPEDGWDGRAHSRRMPPGLYRWTAVIHFAEGDSKSMHGWVQLIR